MKTRNDFLLPDELGWECNDKLSEMLMEYAVKMVEIGLGDQSTPDNANAMRFSLSVCTAQYMDDMYALIKKYQAKHP